MTMIFIVGLAAGWIVGSMAVVVCSIFISSGERDQNDKEQMEYLEKWSEQHRQI